MQGRYLEVATGLYEFRRRVYNSALGQWLRRDPAGYVAGLNYYEAFHGSPVAALDPHGLQATKPASAAVTDGQLSWTLAPEKNGATIDLYYKPNSTCKCDNISFIQVIHKYSKTDQDGKSTTTHGGPDSTGPYWSQFESKDGSWVDHTKGETKPYYGAVWKDDDKNWVADRRGGPGRGSRGIPANLQHTPTGSGMYTVVFRAESCAVCIDTKKVFGCLNWGFDALPVETHIVGDEHGNTRDLSKYHVTISGGQAADVTLTPSPSWIAAKDQWNTVANGKSGWYTF
jgi:RHS repeat-associated protein